MDGMDGKDGMTIVDELIFTRGKLTLFTNEYGEYIVEADGVTFEVFYLLAGAKNWSGKVRVKRRRRVKLNVPVGRRITSICAFGVNGEYIERHKLK